ncbi:PA2169 family four-helix-bundle protein [Luteolibacter pohnpeiensis]|uniref:PA2169 family four-helix-bundle protein n=1 Tax=Luteolibacter pohnpeiensis TaxID=454153 RepID=A0A934VPT2_9BACT|nr:PA2169 family four-helix-bundle protein [Luteolibacter pohnpeiensis]MBK1881361.1 PA2169 family four-helix-bundle protein [Luteolibacter pohnpeiensis]
MTTIHETSSAAAAELQELLTRYVDSRDGYRQAAQLVKDGGLAAALTAIADRREEISERVATIIYREGKKPEMKGSPEAKVHRWWIRLRDELADHETNAILAECLRGEKDLHRTMVSALEEGHLEPEHRLILQEVLSEIDLAIRSFKTALGET